MLRVPKATGVSSRLCASLPSSSFRVVAVLQLDEPGERRALQLLDRYTSGRGAIWRVLAMRRDADALRVAVEWPRRRAASWFVLVTIGFADGVVDCRFHDSATDARAALATWGEG